VLEGLEGEGTIIAELIRREGLYPNIYDNRSKGSLKADQQRLESNSRALF